MRHRRRVRCDAVEPRHRGQAIAPRAIGSGRTGHVLPAIRACVFAPSTAHPTAKRRGCAAESNATAWQILIADALHDRLVADDPEEPIRSTTITLDPKGRCWSASY